MFELIIAFFILSIAGVVVIVVQSVRQLIRYSKQQHLSLHDNNNMIP